MDDMAIRAAALAAAASANHGSSCSSETVIEEAQDYERYLRTGKGVADGIDDDVAEREAA
jgi:hypothetical protein